ncbi:LANO_0F00232g1_1 [Lachancea nothofagi CBS 11611]|uniref:LANO_0F00232g1_1 n=1 Tax=Lachancea nothofagi CBS 11611 TaxID=1266666 RepID=A0A1G4K589_9SACH|nr:LANO_0F00232g1_1 [Lachancea nothofagi CBS 11611]
MEKENVITKDHYSVHITAGEVLDVSDTNFQTTLQNLYIDSKEEKELIKKLDKRFIPMLAFTFFLSSLDKTNIGNAYTSGMKEDLNLSAHQYSNAVSVFYSTFLAAQLPAVLCLKLIPPRYYMSTLVFCWSVITICSGFVKSYHSLLATRVLLGAFEGGFFPAMTLLISIIYKPQEQGRRIALFFGSAAISGAFGGLIATGITAVHGSHSLNGWQWLYIIEGLTSVTAAAWLLFGLPKDIESFNFLNEKEQSLMVTRAEQQANYIGKDEKFSWKYVLDALKDFKVYTGLLIQFCQNVTLYGFTTFLPATLKLGMGYDSKKAQYMSVPVYLLAAAVFLASAFISDRYNLRGPVIFCYNLVTIIGYILMIAVKNAGVKYFACYLITFSVYTGPGLNVTWTSNNVAPHYKRATALGLNQMFGNLAGAVVGQVYNKSPYTTGNTFSLGCLILANLLATVQVFVFHKRNGEREGLEKAGELKEKRAGDQSTAFRYCL